MNVKELIEKLKELPQDLPIRVINMGETFFNVDDLSNLWVYDIEVSNTGQSGYEVSGEVRLLTSE
jgi:hypothetical protein